MGGPAATCRLPHPRRTRAPISGPCEPGHATARKAGTSLFRAVYPKSLVGTAGRLAFRIPAENWLATKTCHGSVGKRQKCVIRQIAGGRTVVLSGREEASGSDGPAAEAGAPDRPRAGALGTAARGLSAPLKRGVHSEAGLRRVGRSRPTAWSTGPPWKGPSSDTRRGSRRTARSARTGAGTAASPGRTPGAVCPTTRS